MLIHEPIKVIEKWSSTYEADKRRRHNYTNDHTIHYHDELNLSTWPVNKYQQTALETLGLSIAEIHCLRLTPVDAPTLRRIKPPHEQTLQAPVPAIQ